MRELAALLAASLGAAIDRPRWAPEWALRLGVLTVPPVLVASTVALWLALQVL